MKIYNPKNEWICTFITFLLIPLSGLATDIYLPSFPEMQNYFHVSPTAVQSTLTYFLISYGVSMLFVGSIIDSFGRYKIGIFALFIFSLSNIVIVTTHSIHMMNLMRVLQGLAIAFIVVSKRAFLVDIFSGKKLQHYMSILTIVWSMAPITAPFLGGYLQKLFGWSFNFYFLGIFSFLILVLELIYGGEAIKHYKKFNKAEIWNAYKTILTTKDFTFGLFVLGSCYSMTMVFGMSSSFIIENHYGLSAVVTGYCALISGLGLLTGGIIGKTLQHKDFTTKLVTGSICIVILGLLLYGAGFYTDSLLLMMIIVYLLQSSTGFLYTLYFTYCITRFPQFAGVSNGLASGGSYVFTSVFSIIIVHLYVIDKPIGLSYSYITLGVLLLIAVSFFVRSIGKQKKLTEELVPEQVENE
ncbi:MFS transporter [Sphingobacterium sp. SRCM116780]|uniref:MFS transporter n=1 Tax=Sphingobacterium sp. SRCM116780 TaxID=2907623 RepID=UPI001F1D9067|nr:MFS transporter [Sphingobacterium sp. SRCM116780]UIR54651.1 MFS transporter [Sphingobacterium sp. SRCM116780]